MLKHLPILLILAVLFLYLIGIGGPQRTTAKRRNNRRTTTTTATTTAKRRNNRRTTTTTATTTAKRRNNRRTTTMTTTQPSSTVSSKSSSSSGLTTTGKIIVGVLCALIALLIIGMIVMFCYLKKASKVGSSVAGNSGNTSMTNAGNNYTYNSPRPVGKPGPVVFDPNALAYNPPVYNKFIPPVQDPNDLSGGYSGYRPEYPPPYSATVPYGGAFSRLITR